MKTTDLCGFSGVYKYTLCQTISRKSFIITTIFSIICALAVFPFLSWKNGNTDSFESDSETVTEKIYVIDNSGIDGLDFSEAFAEAPQTFTFETTSESLETIEAKVTEENENSIILSFELNLELNCYILMAYYDSASDISGDEVETICSTISSWFSDYKISSLNLDSQLVDMVNEDMSYTIYDASDYLSEEEDDSLGEKDYWLVYICIFVTYMIINLASAMVASSIIEEKSNRIVEYLMTSVRPMALIMGKVLAMLTVNGCQILILAGCAFISSKINNFAFASDSNSLLANYFSADAIHSLTIGNVILCVLLICIGLFLYSLIAGLFAACATKMEEYQQTSAVFTFVSLISFLLSFAALMVMTTSGFNGFVLATMLIPFTSPFVLPGAILIGKASVSTILIGFGLLIPTTYAVLWFVSLCYESVIVTNSSVIKLRQLLVIAKNNRKSASKEATSNE